jgi:aryl-alcohol dehydrogenase-like predicted oxidoreductase
MLEAARRHNQLGQDGLSPLLQVAAEHKVTVVASAPLLQSRVIGQVPERLRAVGPPGLTDAQQALQFVRSTPGLAVALAGMSRTQHVAENLALAALPPMTAEAWRAVFQV